MFSLQIFSVTLLCCLGISFGLECFKCQDVEFTSSSSFIKSIIGDFQSNKACSSTKFDMLDHNVQTVTCSSGQVCGLMKGTFSGSYSFFGSVQANFYVRDCMDSYMSSGCLSETNDGSVLKGFLGFLSKLGELNVDADSCYCSYSYCIAGGCASDEWAIGPVCLKKWLVGVIGGGILLLIVGAVTCCCCCCCACCKRNAAPQPTIITVPTPSFGQPTASGYTQFTNEVDVKRVEIV